ncbi:PaaI family thioesterase [Mycobacterium sp. CBMA293]|uniref:PaaI family thioesterase n=1 Tax=unclassified Mycolicibacterium TaxID=2636767 RepID=UPI001324387A|nr:MULTISPECIES: PaaI family thioesterase [unclassified Mycolicibacterium]MUL44776.1 PaaI family thioesterase [Mycolicibacterium sp. CBMA 360]MUL92998.1 PaaI family thioesterase [Mycolicibacterium sp. CBMA 230]MUM35853.1 PaaI family thioesterase [Mycolicibacterium sp. CBMA 361]MUL58115.1 PaaI family thioesterase [Mycolicibacterium sp. CBMA 335]MUL73573.1 PaaI family thioesterase [Mycolicibacterium sp. CBMA 311]
MEPETETVHEGGGFNPPKPTTKGGPDYGRFVESVRTVSDLARGVDAPDDVITQAANLIEQANALLAPFDADEWHSPSGRRLDLPNRGGVLNVPADFQVTDGRIAGSVRFRRFHLGRNGAAHGGAIGLFFDSLLGQAAYRLTKSPFQRTAYLHINYRQIVPVERDLQATATLERVEGRKIFLTGALLDGDTVLADTEALFVKLKPGQP